MGEDRAFLQCVVEKPATKIAKNTYELLIQKPEQFTFVPGQSMKFSFPDLVKEDGSVRYPSFTIASAPHEHNLRFVFRGSRSPLKTHLLSLKKGDHVEMRDVLRNSLDNAVYPDTDDTPVVMFACGVGIAPFLSMARHAEHIQDTRTFRCLYANPTETDIAYKKEIDLLIQNPTLNISCDFFLTREEKEGYSSGYFTDSIIDSALHGLHSPLLHIVGPPEMVEGFEQVLREMFHIPSDMVRTKKYKGYEGEEDTIPE